jgi:tellurite resistance protein
MSFIKRSTSVVSAPRLPYRTIPASFFAIPLGLVALGLAWRTAESIWSEPKWVADTLIWFGATLWVLLLVAYLGKWLLRRADAMVELEQPIQSCYIGLAGVVSLLASIDFSTTHRTLSLGCFCFGIAWTLIFAIYQTGRFWMGDSKPETLTPILYLPMVAGAFVSASACATMGLQFAAPAVGAVAYLSVGVGGGTPDIFAYALIGYAPQAPSVVQSAVQSVDQECA